MALKKEHRPEFRKTTKPETFLVHPEESATLKGSGLF